VNDQEFAQMYTDLRQAAERGSAEVDEAMFSIVKRWPTREVLICVATLAGRPVQHRGRCTIRDNVEGGSDEASKAALQLVVAAINRDELLAPLAAAVLTHPPLYVFDVCMHLGQLFYTIYDGRLSYVSR
jgi:hypothetical protein